MTRHALRPIDPADTNTAGRIRIERCVAEGSTLTRPLYRDGWVVMVPEAMARRLGIDAHFEAGTWVRAMALARMAVALVRGDFARAAAEALTAQTS